MLNAPAARRRCRALDSSRLSWVLGRNYRTAATW
jgi:hypothetical protein